MSDFLLKEDGFYLLKEDGFKLILDRRPTNIITSSYDVLFNLADSAGTRDKVQLNFEFKRNISVNMT